MRPSPYPLAPQRAASLILAIAALALLVTGCTTPDAPSPKRTGSPTDTQADLPPVACAQGAVMTPQVGCTRSTTPMPRCPSEALCALSTIARRGAAPVWERACDEGDLGACNDFGVALWRGEGVGLDRALARNRWERACEGGEPSACGNLAVVTDEARLSARAFKRWTDGLEGPCRDGSLSACLSLGRALIRETPSDSDDAKRGAALLERLCKRDIAPACAQWTQAGLQGRAGIAPEAAKRAVVDACAAVKADKADRATTATCAAGPTGLFMDPAPGNDAALVWASMCSGGYGPACWRAALYPQGCGAGDDRACAEQAHRDARSALAQPGTPNVSDAIARLERLCELGADAPASALACARLGQLALSLTPKAGSAIWPPDQHNQRITAYLTRACALAHLDSCTTLAARLIASTTPDPERAAQLTQRACRGDHAEGCRLLGKLRAEYPLQNEPPDPRAALTAYAKACRLGDDDACAEAGRLMASGASGTPDPQGAAALLEPACMRDALTACVVLGALHEDGALGQADASRAETIYTRACDAATEPAATAEGCRRLGILIERRNDPAQLKRAAKAYIRGCEANDTIACLRGGDIHATGRGIPVNTAKAKALFERACTLGDADGCKRAR